MKKELYKYRLSVDGMMCGMCEAHVNNIVRKHYPNIKKVKSSARKNETIILSLEELNQEELKATIDETGYIVKNITLEK